MNPSNVLLNWESQDRTNNYHVIIATDSSFNHIVSDQTVTSSTIILDKLKPDTHYYWKVTSVSSGKEKQIGMYSFSTKITTIPAAPIHSFNLYKTIWNCKEKI
ncbi:fibronectin type III domain-containing protein [Neobacillus sp. NRS-1170]|uniref:fibronectin type III domain-containing protein n=1 Tax=Neobacillus sp. NRS-1170 TaxID=3233898 RepID=UPI003D2BEAC6